MLEILAALLVGYLFGYMRREKTPFVLAYEAHALQLGFRHKRLFNNWQVHNQTLANQLVSELAGRQVDEISADWIRERLESTSMEATAQSLNTYIIEQLYAVGGIKQGNISLRSLGLLLLGSSVDQTVLASTVFYKQFFDNAENYGEHHNRLQIATQTLTTQQVAESKLYELGRLGLILNIAARYEGKVNW